MTLPLRRFEKDPRALEELLRSGQVRRAPAPSPGRMLPTGVGALDAALGGGLRRGHLHEIVAPAGAGGTALLRAALGAATRAGELCALIDPADSFDPGHAGIDLRRLLWARPGDVPRALRAAELALEARFALVAVDLGEVLPPPKAPPGVRLVRFAPGGQGGQGDGGGDAFAGGARRPSRAAGLAGASPWARLSRRAERHGGALLLLAREPMGGTFAFATVELERGASLWEGRPGAPGRFLRGASAVGAVARHKGLAPSGPISLSFPAGEQP